MSTQTGSISFESTGNFSQVVKQNYATLSQIKGQFAVCSTGASTAEKIATTVPTNADWTLYAGATVTVKFTSANTASVPTLNVNGTGPKEIRDYNANELLKAAREWPAGAAIAFTYDGTYWRIQDSNLMERVHSAETRVDQTATSITSLASMEDNYTKPDGTTATNKMKSYVDQTAEGITTTIESVSEQVGTIANPNLAAWFSMPKDNVYNAETNPSGYWKRITTNSSFTTYNMCVDHNGSGGWAHFAGSITSDNHPFVRFEPVLTDLKADTDYTFLLEIDKLVVDSTIKGIVWRLTNGTDQTDTKDPFTGAVGTGGTATVSPNGEYHIKAKTRADMSAATALGRAYVQFYGTGTFDVYARISLYEGEYSGPYKPYVPISEYVETKNTVNQVKQTADSNSRYLSNLTQTLGTNVDGTTKTDDIVHQYNKIDETLDGTVEKVGKLETHVDTIANPNLTPWFSTTIEDYYNIETNPDAYWRELHAKNSSVSNTEGLHAIYDNSSDDPTTWPDNLEGEGWAHIILDSRTSAGNDGSKNCYLNMHVNFGHLNVEESKEYTWLAEIRNLTWIGASSSSYLYVRPSIGNATLDKLSTAFSNNMRWQEDGDGRIVVTAKSDFSVLDGTKDTRGYAFIPTGCYADFWLRVSLYEGDYKGPYKPYVDSTLSSRMLEAETQIIKNYDAIILRATKSEVYQSGQPNLTPFFSKDMSNIYHSIDNPTGYWYGANGNPSSISATWISCWNEIGDGWAHIEATNSGSSTVGYYAASDVAANEFIETGKKYTILTEMRNCTGNPANIYASTGATDTRFPGSVDQKSKFSIGAYTHYDTLTARDANTSTNPSRLFNFRIQVAAGESFSCDVRVSVYEGEYSGPYKPYVGSKLYPSQSELKITADGISSEVSKINSVKYVNTNYSRDLATLKSWAAEGHSDSWTISTDNTIRVGDTVYIKCQDTTRNCPVYIKVKVTAVTSSSRITGISHGYEDVLPVDTIKSTINQSSDTVKIQANHIEIDGTATFKNSNNTTTTLGNYLSNNYDSKGSASAVQDNLDNLKVGGANLLWRTFNPNMGDMADGYWSKWIADDTVEKTADGIKITCSSNSATSFRIPLAQQGSISVGDKLVLSFDYRGNLTGAGAIYMMCNPAPNISCTMTALVESTTNWVHFEQAFSFSGSPGGPSAQIMFPYRGVTGKWLEIKDGSLMLEKATKASSWQPSTADLTGYTDEALEGGINLAQTLCLGTIQTTQNVTCTGIGPTTIRLNGTSAAQGAPGNIIFRAPVLQPGKYCLWLTDTNNGNVWFRLGKGSSNTHVYSTSGNHTKDNPYIFDVTTADMYAFYPVFKNGVTFSNFETSYMLEKGEKATVWKPAPEDLVSKTQRIYYRTTSSTKPTAPSTWVTEAGDKWAANNTTLTNWTTKVTPISNGKGASVTKYLYLWTCEQSVNGVGLLTNSVVLLDDSTTVIDGGNIITGTVTANQLNATNINASHILTVGSMTTETQGDILNSNIQIGGRNFIRNTQYFNGWTNCGSGTAGTFDTSLGTFTYPTVTANGWTEIRPNANILYSYVRNRTVTLSAEVKAASGTNISVMIDPYLSTTENGDRSCYRNVYLTLTGGGVNGGTITADGTWQKVYAVVDINDSFFSSGTKPSDLDNCYFGTRLARLNTNYNTYIIRHVMIEAGNKLSDWSPAPEDIESTSTGLGIKWNYSAFSTANNGEAYLCNWNQVSGTFSDTDGWVWFNGLKRVVSKGMVNPNSIALNKTIYIVCRLSSATATAGTNYIVWYNSGWKYLSTGIDQAASGAAETVWSWDNAKDMVLASFVMLDSDSSELVNCEQYTPPLTSQQVTSGDTAYAKAAAAQTTANTANNRSIAYRATSSTTAATAAKEANCTNFTLVSGAYVTVRFQYSNTSTGALTLNVNSTGAKNIYVCRSATSGDNRLLWADGAVIDFYYDGTQWLAMNTVKSWYGSICSTAEGTAAKTTNCPEIIICRGTTITVPFSNSNTSDSMTLNVNSTGACTVYHGSGTTVPTKINGTTGNGMAWPAGEAVIFTYDGKNWRTGNQTFIDGGHITTGSISADRIKTNVVNAINATADKIDAKNINVNEIEIGKLDGYDGLNTRIVSGENALTKVNYYNRYAQAKQSTTLNTDKPWYKFAAVTITTQNTDRVIKFDVMSDMYGVTKYGTLVAHVRVGANIGSIDYKDFVWLDRNSAIDPDKFLLVYKLTSGTSLVAELWCKLDELGWHGFIFNQIYESGTETSPHWTLYQTVTRGSQAAVTSGYTQQASIDASTAFLTRIDENGIKIHPASTEDNRVEIKAAGMQIYKGGYLKANYSDTITLYGGSNASGANPKVELSSETFNMYDNAGRKRVTINTSGLTVYDTSTTPIDVANFGSTVGTTGTAAFARIGLSNSTRFEISPTTLSAYTGNTKYFEVSASGLKYGSGLGNTAATTTQINNVTNGLGGFTIRWNASTFSNTNAGEAYICKMDPLTGVLSDADGWVMWNSTKRTISKGMINPDTMVTYNVPVYVVCRLTAANGTTGTNYLVWYNSGWKYLSKGINATTTDQAVATWTWVDTTDIIIGKFVEPSSEASFNECEIYNPPLHANQIGTTAVTATSANANANNAAKTATNYMSFDNSTLKIASASPGTQKQRIELTSNSLKMFTGDGTNGTQRFSVDSTNGVIVGRTDQGHVTITDSGISIFGTSGEEAAFFGAAGTSGDSAYARIGNSTNSRFVVTPTALRAYTGTATSPFFEVSANGLKYGTNLAATTEQLGNKNLIRNGNFINSTNYWVADGATITVENDSTHGKVLKVVTSSGSYRTYPNTSYMNHGVGTYSINFYAKASAACTLYVCKGGSTNTTNQYHGDTYSLTTSWQNFTGSLTTTETGSLSFKTTSAATFYLAKVMVVNGSKAVTFEPHPLDIQNDADNAAKTATNYMSYNSTDGLRIASASPGTQKQRIQLTSSSLKMFDANSQQRLSLNSTDGVIVGNTNQGHVTITDTGMTIYNSTKTDIGSFTTTTSNNETTYVRIGPSNNSRVLIKSTGMEIFKGTKFVASFGESVLIGDPQKNNVTISDKMFAIKYNNGLLASFQAADTNSNYVADRITLGPDYGNYGVMITNLYDSSPAGKPGYYLDLMYENAPNVTLKATASESGIEIYGNALVAKTLWTNSGVKHHLYTDDGNILFRNWSNFSIEYYNNNGDTIYLTKDLYNNVSGSNGTINLSQSVASFDYLGIWVKDNNDKRPQVFLIPHRGFDDISTDLFCVEASSNVDTIIRRTRYTFTTGTNNGTRYYRMEPSFGNYIQFNGTTWVSGAAGINYIKITRVIGYKI